MSQTDTRSKLLQAATEVFSESGYRAASTREISRRGGVNLAAIHYHFGDKANLYREVFRSTVTQKFNAFAQLDIDSVPLAEALDCFYRSMIPPTAEDGPLPLQFMRLHAREEADPSGVLEDALSEAIRPNHEKLKRLICRELAVVYPDLEISRLAFCLFGMISVYLHGRSVVEIISPELIRDKHANEEMIHRLVGYATALIAAEREGGVHA
jgi:AcrR family transcriptional regulator